MVVPSFTTMLADSDKVVVVSQFVQFNGDFSPFNSISVLFLDFPSK